MNLAPRQKAFFLITMRNSPEKLDRFLEFLSNEDRVAIEHLKKELGDVSGQSMKQVVGGELRRLSQSKSQSFLGEVHEDWIVEKLIAESPAMIATVLRYLPAERVNQIMDKLPESLLDKMPQISETFNTPKDLVTLLKQKFESEFPIHRSLGQAQKIEFGHFCLLRRSQIERVFLEIGYREIALGFMSLPKETQDKVLGRFEPKDQSRVEYYLDHSKSVSKQRIKQAQAHLVRQDIDMGDSQLFIRELGFLVLSKAVTGEDEQDVRVIQYKLSKQEGTFLSKLVHEEIVNNTAATIVGYREDVLSAMNRVLASNR